VKAAGITTVIVGLSAKKGGTDRRWVQKGRLHDKNRNEEKGGGKSDEEDKGAFGAR